ncbi:MAG: hypothetical protein KAT96_00080 [Candidatus Omnitrophica bacterium]|nr:hypothetical protein [Candidatus Omnitrophota bacterium]
MRLNSKKGAVLLIAVFIIFLCSILVMGFLEVAVTEIEISRNLRDGAITAYIADTGVEAAVYDLLNGGDGNISRTEFTVNGNTYYYTVNQTNKFGNIYTIESTGSFKNFQRVVEARIGITGIFAFLQYWKEK